VAAVAAEHSGAVAVTNAPGGGALFSIRLPLVPGAAAPGNIGRAADQSGRAVHRAGGSLRL
jgi:hypothetical protein